MLLLLWDILSQRLNYYKSLDHSDLASKTLVNDEEVRKQIDDKISYDTLRKELKRQERYLLFLITFLKIRSLFELEHLQHRLCRN